MKAPKPPKMLLDHGMRTKPKNKKLESVLMWPAMQGYTKAVSHLLAAGVEAGKTDDPLMAAAAFGHVDTAKVLAKAGFDIQRSIKTMERYKNDTALAILRKLR